MMFRMASLACFALCLAGCAGEDETVAVMDDHSDHDHGDHGDHDMETPGEAFHTMEHLHATIADGFAKDDAKIFHDPMHDVQGVLSTVKELVDESEADEATKKAVAEQVAILKKEYKAVDAQFHGGEGPEYSEVSEKIDAAMVALKEAMGELAEHDHGHDGEGHDDDDHDHGEDHDDDEKE